MASMEELLEQQRARIRNPQSFRGPQFEVNPFYQTNPFEPTSQLSNVAGDPQLGEPLPSGRFVDQALPSPLSLQRMQQAQQTTGNVQEFLRENGTMQLNEQSLIDKGKTMLSRLFDYQDDKDAQLFGINVSAVETVWDGALRYITGFYDLLSLGYGGLISAAPGGIRTLSYDELSAGKSVGEILSGEMDREAAPSPGQIFVASVGEAASRVRSGDARLGDLLQVSGLIGMAAVLGGEESPLQQPGFDIMDKEQREQAFATGWERWTSGITDFGLAFADPLIGAGVALKVMRAGMLGAVGPAKLGARFQQYSGMALDELGEAAGVGVGGLQREADELIQYGAQVQKLPTAGGPIAARGPAPVRKPLTGFTVGEDGPKRFRNPLAQAVYDMTARKPDGEKLFPLQKIMERPEIRALAIRADVADLMYKTDSPFIALTILGDLHGTPGARQALESIAPATADITFRMRFSELHSKRLSEPQKVAEAVQGLRRVIENLDRQATWIADQAPKAGQDPAAFLREQRLTLDRYTNTQRQAQELIDSVESGIPPDKMNPQSAFFDMNYTDRVMEDLHRQSDVVTEALNKSLSDAAAQAKMYFPLADNPYARMVSESRRRRQKAAYEYGVEGTNILPRRVVTAAKEGEKPKTQMQWWSSSQFEDVSRFRRNARVWRWMGTATPSGFISLKGTSLVNQDREMGAVLDLDVYTRGDIQYERMLRDKDGNLVIGEDGQPIVDTGVINGAQRRDELMRIFTDSMNSPDKDPLKAILEIESQIASDLGKAYGFTDDQVKNMMLRANKGREGVVELVRQRGFYIDPVDGTRHYSPYLMSQLANGTFMHNFQAIEAMMRRESMRDGGKRMGEWMDNIGGLAGGAYDTFNSLWRPAVLMRMSYTQRNVFEGMVRAMAYQASLAPLLWPVKATRYGIRNKRVASRVGKMTEQARAQLKGSSIDVLRRRLDDATMERLRFEQAFSVVRRDKDGKEIETWYVNSPEGGRQSTYIETSPGDIDKGLARATANEAAARAELEANPNAIFEALDGTEAGRWLKTQVEGKKQELAEQQARADQVRELIGQTDADGNIITPDDVAYYLRELEELQNITAKELHRLQFDPVAALNQYQSVAGRAKRIGSGTSIGPDGSYYNNAFEGPWEQIARANMSADNTIKQQFSLHADVMGNLWRRTMLRTNAPIKWDARNPDQWIAGMRSVIEMNSSDPLVRALVEADFDVDEGMRWLLTTQQGRDYLAKYQGVQGSEGLMTSNLVTAAERRYGETSKQGKVLTPEVSRRVKGVEESVRRQGTGSRPDAFTEAARGPGYEQMTTFADVNMARQHIIDLVEKVMDQMQRQAGFLQLLRQRSLEKSRSGTAAMDGATEIASTSLSDDAIRSVLDSLPPEVKDNLGYVQGSELIDMGTTTFMEKYAALTGKAFRVLGTIPEDSVTRGPFYAGRFKAARDDMIEMYLIRTGRAAAIKRGTRMKAPGGREHGGTITHDEFTIPAGELQRIYFQAHKTALADTREWMYTIERRTKLGKYGEWIFPFISAQQNSVTVVGKLLYKEPWLAPFIYDMWRAPQLAGFEDDKGNIQLPMPLPWINDFLRENPDIPVVGGILGENDMLTIPKNSLNLWIPETGFGVAPTPTPFVQIAASELMKRNMFPPETPQIVRNVMGDKNGDEFYKSFKEYIFGEGQGPSSNFLSWEKVFPAYAQKALFSRDELSAQYGYQFQLQWATQMYRYRSGERDTPPDYPEISKRTTNMLWFQAFGNFGAPTPLTPYPILTRPDVKSPIAALQEQYRKYQQTDSREANVNFYNDYGDLALMVANTKITRNTGGANPTPEAVSDSQTLAPLIQRVVGAVDNPDVLGILVNNRSTNGAYDDSSYEWQKSNLIPGLNVEWKQVQAPGQSISERQRIVGWTEYKMFMDRLDAMLASAGFSNYEQKGAAEYKRAKQLFIDNMLNNPERDGWAVDYTNNGTPKAVNAVRTLQIALEDKTFVNLIGNHDAMLLSSMQNYLRLRSITRALVEESGKSINDPVNFAVKDAWLTARQKLAAHPRFGEIMNSYLYGDEEPADVGVVGTNRYITASEGQ